jgi:DNA polymerase epsilon subunit 2
MLRPVAFRTLTKKHNLTLTSSGLGLLSSFVGKFCGSGWREEGLAERVLDEIAKAWKRQSGGVIIEDGPDKQLSAILKMLEPCMSAGKVDVGRLSRTNSSVGSLSRQNSLQLRPEVSRETSQTSLGFSSLDVTDDADLEMIEDDVQYTSARPFLKVISAFDQPQLTYTTTNNSVQPIKTPPTILPPIQQKIALFRNRYHMIHARLLRNPAFQTSSVATQNSIMHNYKITPISNLLGRSTHSFVLLGLLAHTATSDLAVTDPSGSVVLDISSAKQVPPDSSFICPGMIVLLEGTYLEDGSNTSNLGGAAGVGGQIKGRFIVETIANPPPERREVSMAVGHDLKNTSTVGAGLGWVDFLGVGSEKAVGSQMRRLQSRILNRDQETGSKVIVLGECNLDLPIILSAIRAILALYNTVPEPAPLAIILMGNFVSTASLSGTSTGSVDYKEHFDALASILSEFPKLLSSTTFIFVPGDNDPWASTFSSGAATAVPRTGVPELFTSRVKRAIATANSEVGVGRKGDGEAVWTSNPARISLFGPVGELVLFRDDVSGRMRRNCLTLGGEKEDEAGYEPDASHSQEPNGHDADIEAMDTNPDLPTIIDSTSSQHPTTITNSTTSTQKHPIPLSRKITASLLPQSSLSPFPLSTRPQLWSYATSLNLYPLPTALLLCDAEAPSFSVVYEGCAVLNVGTVVDLQYLRKEGGAGFQGTGTGGGGKGNVVATWVEWDGRRGRGVVRDVRF